MRHRILTCKNHPDLRWSCKDIAWTPASGDRPGGYNGSRTLGFRGKPTGQGMFSDMSGMYCSLVEEVGNSGAYVAIEECDCPLSDFVLAPEDAQVRE